MKKRIISMSLLVAMLISTLVLYSCKKKEVQPNVETNPIETDETYDFGTLDFEWKEFRMLNTAQPYGFYSNLDFESATGNKLDDAVYARNRQIEEQYHCDIVVDESYQLEEAATRLQDLVLSGENTYEVAFLRDYWIFSLITGDCLVNLDDYTQFQFDQAWWDSETMEEHRVGTANKMFFALSDISLVDFEGTMAMYFNSDMMTSLGLQAPYQMVRDGEWTLEVLTEYSKLGVNLNGDDSFAVSSDGTCIYGHVGFQHTYNALLASAGFDFVKKSEDGQLSFALNTAQFIDVADYISSCLTIDNGWMWANDGPYYHEFFASGRSLFMSEQLKLNNSSKLQNNNINYGIVPIPKIDASSDYMSMRTYTYVMCMPVTNSHASETATILDAMAYLSHKNILSVFYDEMVKLRLGTNPESAEMLEIIRTHRTLDHAMPYGVYDTIGHTLSDAFRANKGGFASWVAALELSINANLELLMGKLNS